MALIRSGPIAFKAPDNHLSAEEWKAHFTRLQTRSGSLCEAATPHCLAGPDGQLFRLTREMVSVQHRRAQGAGGTSLEETNSLSNLLLICGTGTTGCHGWMETQERKVSRGLGFVVEHTYDDHRPVPVYQYPVLVRGGRWRLLHPTVELYVELPVHLRYSKVMPELDRETVEQLLHI